MEGLSWHALRKALTTPPGALMYPVCAWNTRRQLCGIGLPVTRSSLTQRRLCRLRGQLPIWESISSRVWYAGRNSIVEVLLGVGVALEIGLGLS